MIRVRLCKNIKSLLRELAIMHIVRGMEKRMLISMSCPLASTPEIQNGQ